MTRVRAAAAALLLGLLAGCSASEGVSSAPTDEAVVGGLETVEPGFEDITAQGVVDAIEQVGAYDCTEDGSGWQCTAVDGSGGAITVAGAPDEEPTVAGGAPVDNATVEAVAVALATTTDDVYSDDTGLAWPAE